MKTQLHIQDHTCPLPPVMRKFAADQMALIIKKDPRITAIRLKVRTLPGPGTNDVYKITAIATGRGATTLATERSVTVRAGLKAIRSRVNRRLIRQPQEYSLGSIGIQLKE